VALRTGVQEVVLTGGTRGRPLELFLDGRPRTGGPDGHRHHQALVHPAMTGPHARVLVLGGGDGLAVREVLRHPGVDRVDVVDPDAGVVRLARRDPALSALNRHALDDPRVRVAAADCFAWLRGARQAAYDVVVSDLPDPGVTDGTKLYSREFYGLARRALAPGGRLVVHTGPVSARPRVFWTVESTLRAAGFRTAPYRVDGRRAGHAAGPGRGPDHARGAVRDRGFVLAARSDPGLRLVPDVPRPRTLTDASLAEGARAVSRTRVRGLPPSTLVHPRYRH
jgi:spermidine synthase